MTEADLALKFIDYFSDFDIYKEVPGGGGVIDIVPVKGGIRIAVEVKVQLSFEVIWQAFLAKNQVHYSYAAVPFKDHGKDVHLNWGMHPAQKALCIHLEIGVLGYMLKKNGKYEIREVIAPKLNRRPRKIYLHNYMKRSQAGSQSNRMTAFGYFVECFTTVVARHPEGISFEEVFKQLDFKHYRTVSLFKNAAAKYCRTGVIKNIEFYKGKFKYVQPNTVQLK